MRAHFTPARALALFTVWAVLALTLLAMFTDTPTDPQLTPQTVAPATPYSTEEP